MKIRLLTAIAFTAMAIFSCSEDTNNIGGSLTQDTDNLKISTGIYQATSCPTQSMPVTSIAISVW